MTTKAYRFLTKKLAIVMNTTCEAELAVPMTTGLSGSNLGYILYFINLCNSKFLHCYNSRKRTVIITV